MFCPYCGKEISSEVKFCPHCGKPISSAKETAVASPVSDSPSVLSPQEKTETKTDALHTKLDEAAKEPAASSQKKAKTEGSKIGYFVFLIIIALFFYACGHSSDSKSPSASASQTTAPSQQSKENNKAPAYEPWTVDIDGLGKVKGGISSNVGIAVIGVDVKKSIGDSMFNENAKGKFVIVKLAVSNGQKDAVTVDSTSFSLIDDKDRKFDVSTEGLTALQMSNGNDDGFLSKINPGITAIETFPFDVPTDVQGLKLQASGGMTGKQIILPLEVQMAE